MVVQVADFLSRGPGSLVAVDSDLQLLFTISMHVYTKAFRMCHTASVPSVYQPVKNSFASHIKF